jgi:hypothetical protein
MNNKNLLKYEDKIKKFPFYVLWLSYIFKYKKFPYFMEYEGFRYGKLTRQFIYSVLGIKVIDIIFNLSLLLNKK